MAHIASCAPCQKCLEACPVFAGDFYPTKDGGAELVQAAERWLAACVACGMCEDICPKHLPLTVIIGRIKRAALDVAGLTTDAYPSGVSS